MTPMSTATKAFIGLVLFVVAGLGIQTWRLTARTRELDALRLAPARAATLTAAARVETVTVRLAAVRDTVVRVLRGAVRTDTLVLAPQTRQDTATALQQLPALAAKYDTLKASCSALVVSCDAFQVAAKAQRGADSTYIGQLETQLHRAQPSRFGAAWSKAKFPLAFAGGLWLGLQAK